MIRSLAISQDNQVFASGSDDGSVVVCYLFNDTCRVRFNFVAFLSFTWFQCVFKISSLVKKKRLASCNSHSRAWVTDIAFGENCIQLVTVGNNIQVGFALFPSVIKSSYYKVSLIVLRNRLLFSISIYCNNTQRI